MTIFLLGDSTCAAKTPDSRPETGWGEYLPHYIADSWTVENHALNGLATKDMLSRGLFQTIAESVLPDDIVLLQFGHNDSKKDDSARYSAPWSEYKANLVFMAEAIKAKRAYPVFLTPIARRRFADGIVVDTHGDYPAAMKAAAYQADSPCFDLTIPTMLWLQREGEEGSKRFFMNFGPGLYPNYPDGNEDNTHLRPEGAEIIAEMIARMLSPVFTGVFMP